MEIQRLSSLSVNPNKPLNQAKAKAKTKAEPTREPTTSSVKKERTPGEVLISVSSTVADSNDIDLSGNHLSFTVDSDTGTTVINIVDDRTGEVIRQIPRDEILNLKKAMGSIQGLVLDQKV